MIFSDVMMDADAQLLGLGMTAWLRSQQWQRSCKWWKFFGGIGGQQEGENRRWVSVNNTPQKSNELIRKIAIFLRVPLPAFQGPSFWGPPAVRFRECNCFCWKGGRNRPHICTHSCMHIIDVSSWLLLAQEVQVNQTLFIGTLPKTNGWWRIPKMMGLGKPEKVTPFKTWAIFRYQFVRFLGW